MKRPIHLCDSAGRMVYNRLIDDGSNVFRFDSGHGHVAREDLARLRLTVHDGWIH